MVRKNKNVANGKSANGNGNNCQKKQPAMRRVRRPRANRRNGSGAMRDPTNMLIPSGVNNRATMPRNVQSYSPRGEEVIAIIQAGENAQPGDVLFNKQISHESVQRLARLSTCFQRAQWLECSLNLVALNGSTVTSGYTAGFIEDPEVTVPTSPSDVIPFLAALRGTSVRQNWVQSKSGQLVNIKDLPEMYTTKGQDPRRFFIGRYIVALAGSPGPNTTFQLMLKYHVRFSVPAVLGTDQAPTDHIIQSDVFPGTIGVDGAGITNPISPTDINSASGPPPPGIYAVPNATVLLKRGAVSFGWNEDDEGDNELYYRDWPSKFLAQCVLKRVATLVVPTGATTYAQCGFQEVVGGEVTMFGTLTLATATALVTPDSEDASGVDLTIPDGLSWLTPIIPRDNIIFLELDLGVNPDRFARIANHSDVPIITSGTPIKLIAPAPTTLETQLQQLQHEFNRMVVQNRQRPALTSVGCDGVAYLRKPVQARP